MTPSLRNMKKRLKGGTTGESVWYDQLQDLYDFNLGRELSPRKPSYTHTSQTYHRFTMNMYSDWKLFHEVFGVWLHIIQKLMQHSSNPYTPMMFFPTLDCMFKATLAHSLHHTHPKRNFFTIPYHHLFYGYGPDLKLYNQTFKTNISF